MPTFRLSCHPAIVESIEVKSEPEKRAECDGEGNEKTEVKCASRADSILSNVFYFPFAELPDLQFTDDSQFKRLGLSLWT
jgi:hypothetical protein